VWLNVLDVDRRRVSTSDQTLEVVAGHQQIALQAVNQLEKNICYYPLEIKKVMYLLLRSFYQAQRGKRNP